MAETPPDESKKKLASLRARVEHHLSSQGVGAAGRTDLLAKAHMSATSLHAILSDKLPWQSGGDSAATSPRQYRAWARTFVRLAAYFSMPVEEWLEGVGMPRDGSGLARTIDDAVRDEQDRITRLGTVQGVPSASDPLERIDSETHGPIRVAMLEYPPFSTPNFFLGQGTATDGKLESFFQHLTRRLLGAIQPECAFTADTEERDFDALIEHLDRSYGPPDSDLVLGLFATVNRRYRGLDFVAIPGWRIELAAVHFAPEHGSAPPLTWASLLSPSATERFDCLVIEGEAAQLFLQGQLGFDRNRNLRVICDLETHEDLANELEHFAVGGSTSAPTKMELFVADEGTCLEVVRILNDRVRREKRGSAAKLLAGETWEVPHYDMAIATSVSFPRWTHLIESAMREEILGNGYLTTAYAYAAVMAVGVCSNSFDPERPPSTCRPAFFRLDNSLRTMCFWKELYRSFTRILLNQGLSNNPPRWIERADRDEFQTTVDSLMPAEIEPAIRTEVKKATKAVIDETPALVRPAARRKT